MALQGSDKRVQVLPHGEVMQSGNSFELALDQLGIFSTKQRSSNGLKAISDFKGIDKNAEKLKILVGSPNEIGVSATNKNNSSVPFYLNEIVKAGISFPKLTEQKVDYWRVGWDGINDDTALKFYEGQETEFQLTLEGMPVTFFNSGDQYTVKVPIIVPNPKDVCGVEGEYNCEEVSAKGVVIDLVKSLNDYELPTGRKLSEILDIYPIFSVPSDYTAVKTKNYFELAFKGANDLHMLGKVQAQYPSAIVTKDTMDEKFVLIADSSFTPSDFELDKKDILKGCSTCPTGYNEVEDGFLYAVALEDAGSDKKTAVTAISTNVVADSVVKVGQEFGVGYYLVTLSEVLTEAEKTSFVATNPTAVVTELGKKSAHCTNEAVVKYAWVKKGKVEAITAEYQLMLADDCSGDKLDKLSKAYPDLEISKVKTQNCVTTYKTEVITNYTFSEGCSQEIVEQIFKAEAPRPYAINNFWSPIVPEVVGDNTIKAGFEIKSKPVIINPSEPVLEKLPFIMTSTRILALSGGYQLDYSAVSRRVDRPFNVFQLERAQDLDNLGGNLRGWEKRGNIYFKNEQYSRNPIERDFKGTQSKLDGLVQYAFAYVEISKSNKAGINGREYTDITYGFLVPYGNTKKIEEVFKSLASSAGVPFLIQ